MKQFSGLLIDCLQVSFCYWICFLTDVAHYWALAVSNCISEVLPITYFFVMIVFLPRATIKNGCVIISSTFKLKISFEYILKYLNGSQNRDVVVSFATVQDQTCFDCFFLLSSTVVAGLTYWFWNWLGLVMFIDTVQWIEIGPFLLMECLFGWWNLKAGPLWLMKSIGSGPPILKGGSFSRDNFYGSYSRQSWQGTARLHLSFCTPSPQNARMVSCKYYMLQD